MSERFSFEEEIARTASFRFQANGMAQESNSEPSEKNVFRSGFIAIIGRPNAGKSTLVNAVVGKKIAITSNRPQTTRHRIRAIFDRDDAQLVMVDTPGIHKPKDALGEELNNSALKALEDVDAIAFVVDASKPIGTGDKWVMQKIAKKRVPKILVLTKIDIASSKDVMAQTTAAQACCAFDDVIATSAQEGFNVDGFVEAAISLMPEGPRWFPEGTDTDQPLEVIIAEFIREKVIRSTHDEVPHSVGVGVEELYYDEHRDLYEIRAVVYVERDSQKGIIIGHRGEMIKQIGSGARVDLERLLSARVFLDLTVKVKKEWRRDAAQIRRFGYGEGL